MSLSREADRRASATDPGRRARSHRRASSAAAQHRQLPQAAEHLRRVHDARAGRGGGGATAPRMSAAVLAFATTNGVNVVPRTGGTATEGGLETPVPNSIVLDGSQMNRIIKIDAYNMQATVQCGVPLQVLEDRARELGLTTGHSPQSKPVAHMGGLVATRSIGQFSTLYGGIEDMVVGARGRLPRRSGVADQERATPRGRARHPPRRDRQRGRAVLHHRGDGQALPLHAGEQRVPRAGR